jgi:hypothetical protein
MSVQIRQQVPPDLGNGGHPIIAIMAGMDDDAAGPDAPDPSGSQFQVGLRERLPAAASKVVVGARIEHLEASVGP